MNAKDAPLAGANDALPDSGFDGFDDEAAVDAADTSATPAAAPAEQVAETARIIAQGGPDGFDGVDDDPDGGATIELIGGKGAGVSDYDGDDDDLPAA